MLDKEQTQKFPKRNTRFELEDFFQIAVDDFHSGEFLFLSAKKVKTESNKNLIDLVESFDEYGWVISTWCYNLKCYLRIFVCEYKQKMWKNSFHIESILAQLNGCNGYAVNSSIEEFVEWMKIKIAK